MSGHGEFSADQTAYGASANNQYVQETPKLQSGLSWIRIVVGFAKTRIDFSESACDLAGHKGRRPQPGIQWDAGWASVCRVLIASDMSPSRRR